MALTDEHARLEALRANILDSLSSMADLLADSDDVSLEALMAIARSTGNVQILEKVLQKTQSLEDSSDKADALLGLLDEVELRLLEDEPDQEQQSTDGDNSNLADAEKPEPTEPPA